MKISQKGINLIKRFESFRAEAYLCPANVLTIGYGHIRTVRAGLKLTEKEAEDLLLSDLDIFEKQIKSLNLKITQTQFDAIVSFCFNVGYFNFLKSTLLKKIKNDTKDFAIAKEFVRWHFVAKKPLRGLLLRRLAEASLYFS